MSEDDIIGFVTGLPGVTAFTASEEMGAPEVAWGDSFFIYDPDGDAQARQRMPFATIVTKDYPGDTVSDLNRPHVFRLNIAVGRTVFVELVGCSPAAYAKQSARFDYTVSDRVLPHPVYATQGWVCVLNPTDAQARSLLSDAHARARRRHRPRG